ncbi:hypothetical protein PUN28_020276 [Cardiocondyla obscurior]
MGDSIPIKGRCFKNINSQKRRMPDVILHTKNVMIPVMKPILFKQSCDIPFLKNRHRIFRTQNCKGNPALFSEAPLRKLHNPLENSLEVKRNDRWKAKNQSTKYTILENTSPNIEKTSTSQNMRTSKELSLKEKNNRVRFLNTVLVQSGLVTDNKDLRKISSRSIKLSRKCNLPQMKESQTKHENISPPLPKIETLVSSVANKPDLSPSQSFYDMISTASTASASSLSSFKIEKMKTFVNIVNRERPRSDITSNHLYPSNSEYEINVLHYENDITSGNNISQLAQSHLKSINTDLSSTYNFHSTENHDNNFANQQSAMKSLTRDKDKTKSNVKYSWETDNWVPPSQRKGLDNPREMKIAEKNGENPYRCKIKYSWQVIGIGTQTSHTLLQNLLNNVGDNKSAYKMRVKYSWQIIGTSTQASLNDYNDPDYWNGILLTPSKNYNRNETEISNNKANRVKLYGFTRSSEERLKKCLILSNQQTQTFADKEIQADPTDCYAKYSWHHLIKQYL